MASINPSTGIGGVWGHGQSFERIQIKLHPPLLQIPEILLMRRSGRFLYE